MRLRAQCLCVLCEDELQPPEPVVFDTRNGDVYCTFCAVDLEEPKKAERKVA
jgi:hypothetical protein